MKSFNALRSRFRLVASDFHGIVCVLDGNRSSDVEFEGPRRRRRLQRACSFLGMAVEVMIKVLRQVLRQPLRAARQSPQPRGQITERLGGIRRFDLYLQAFWKGGSALIQHDHSVTNLTPVRLGHEAPPLDNCTIPPRARGWPRRHTQRLPLALTVTAGEPRPRSSAP